MAFKKGDRGKITRLNPEDPNVLAHTQGFLGMTGTITPVRDGEFWVECGEPNPDTGATGGVFTLDELTKIWYERKQHA